MKNVRFCRIQWHSEKEFFEIEFFWGGFKITNLRGIHEFRAWKRITNWRGSRIVKSRNVRTPCILIFGSIQNSFLTQRWFEKENAICPLWIVLLLSGAIRLKDKKLSSKWQYQQTKALWAIKADKRWYSCGEASGGAKVEYPLSKLKLKGKK